MCPACLASAALMIGGVLSAGGIAGGFAAAVAKLLPKEKGTGSNLSGKVNDVNDEDPKKQENSHGNGNEQA
jgi:hypothetical protein